MQAGLGVGHLGPGRNFGLNGLANWVLLPYRGLGGQHWRACHPVRFSSGTSLSPPCRAKVSLEKCFSPARRLAKGLGSKKTPYSTEKEKITHKKSWCVNWREGFRQKSVSRQREGWQKDWARRKRLICVGVVEVAKFSFKKSRGH